MFKYREGTPPTQIVTENLFHAIAKYGMGEIQTTGDTLSDTAIVRVAGVKFEIDKSHWQVDLKAILNFVKTIEQKNPDTEIVKKLKDVFNHIAR